MIWLPPPESFGWIFVG